MLDHTGIVVTDLVKARAFYDAIAAVGLGTADNFKGSFVLGKARTNIYLVGTWSLLLIEGSRCQSERRRVQCGEQRGR
jgi:catechol 2,3-dioxygenase-like lactoylglutathione lyase family enzyme